jgi:hypothetical protein
MRNYPARKPPLRNAPQVMARPHKQAIFALKTIKT